MRHRSIAAVCAAVALAVLTAAPTFAFAAGNPVISDCVNHGELTHHYTLAQLRGAQAALSAVTKEYTDCSDVIGNALLAAARSQRDRPRPPVRSRRGNAALSTPVLIVLVVLVLAAVTVGALAIRRRRGRPSE